MTKARVELEAKIRIIAETCIENERYFSDLDSVTGDGDFGYSLARGFEHVIGQWESFNRDDAGAFLVNVATAMSSRIGGTSGPIWGTAFLRAGTIAKGKQVFTKADIVEMLRAAIEGIKARGGASLGDKTLLDALVPLTDAIEFEGNTQGPKEVAAEAARAARAGAERTREMVAKRGRASYTGDRSIGALDPGAVAVAVLAERIEASL